ncbi:hypothetical protein LCGC14_0357920 [marine sediment metagenome]|uniref:Uncharacterized protein n=1 Tax=marine sediment metagenome TaxID=412755 RepID=A0A0F9TRT4_9ZZZZ
MSSHTKEELEQMLEDVVNELAIEKDRKYQMLKAGSGDYIMYDYDKTIAGSVELL